MKMRGSSASRLVRFAIDHGLTVDQASGNLARYMRNASSGRITDRICCGFYFVFQTRHKKLVLITVTDLPRDLKEVAANQIKARNENN